MTILAIDTAANFCAACLYDPLQHKVMAQISEDLGRGHAERLLAIVDACFEQAEIAPTDISKVAVSVGPGSFTGIRVGVAAARGLAVALDVTAVGVTTFKAIAHAYAHASNDFAVLVKGGRGQVFAQEFNAAGDESGPPFIIADSGDSAERASLDHIQSFIGNAAADFDKQRAVSGFDQATGLIEDYAQLGSTSTLPPKPVYLRSADAKINANFALPHASVT